MLADDDDELTAAASQKQTSQQPAWMRTLFERCREWLGLLPTVCFRVIWKRHQADIFS
jgi:dynein heavy chain 1